MPWFDSPDCTAARPRSRWSPRSSSTKSSRSSSRLGDRDLVANVLMDVTVMFVDWVRGEAEHFAEKAMDRIRANPLGKWRRPGNVDEEKEPLLGA